MRLSLCILLVGLISGGCNEASSKAPDSAAERDKSTASSSERVEKTGGEVSLKILDHDQIQQLIQDKKGKIVVMDAWSTSCPPCIKEFPHLVELHNEYGPDKVACISLSFDYEGIDKPEDQQERVLAFLRKQNATFDNVLNKEEADELYEKMDLSAVPAVFVYDRGGKLVQRFDDSYRNAAGERFSYKDVNGLVSTLLETETK